MSKMEEAISATNASRNFSRVLEEVRQGRSFVVLSRGKPIAKIVPARSVVARDIAAHAVLLSRLRREPTIEIGRWNRNELY